MVRLGDLFEFKNGRSFKKTEWKQTGLPIIRIQNLNNEDAPFNYFDDEYDSSIEVNSGDLLFSWSGTVGSSFGPHIWHREKGVLNQHIFKLTFKREMEKRYAFYSLLFITAEIERSVVGAVGLVHVTKKSLNEFQIPLPPIPEQQRIVAILDQAFAYIEKARVNAEKNLKNARELFDSYLNQVFSQRGEGWVEISVGDVLTLEYGKPLDKSVRKENGLYPAYGANGVKTRSDEYYCETPSIIVGRKGSAGELTFTEDKYWPLDVTYFVGFNSSKYDLHFLYYMLVRLNLPSLATGVKPGINRNVVYGLRVSVPPLNVQKNVAKKLKNIAYETSKVEGVYKEKLNSLDQLKKSLLQQAFSGELTKIEGHAA